MTEFDYQWLHLPSPDLEYVPKRITELLDYVQLPREWFQGKRCLDAGCGTGRWTWAMQQMGAEVTSFDVSVPAVVATRKINPRTAWKSILDLEPKPFYDFVLCWGVLMHLPDPPLGFRKVASQVRPGGILHVMVYHTRNGEIYGQDRVRWRTMTETERLKFCELKVKQNPGHTVHGWWDALNPEHTSCYSPDEVRAWFRDAGFTDVLMTREININMRGTKT